MFIVFSVMCPDEFDSVRFWVCVHSHVLLFFSWAVRVCPLAQCFWTGQDRMVLHQSVCCGLLCGALCAVHVPRPVRPAVLLEKPVSVSFSLLLFDRQLWGSWISSAHRYERDVECVVVASRK